VPRVNIVLVLGRLLSVQDAEEMGAGNAHLCLIAAFALPHVMKELHRYLLHALPTAYDEPGDGSVIVLLDLEGKTKLVQICHFQHHSGLDNQQQLLQPSVESKHAILIDERLVVYFLLVILFLDDDLIQQLLEGLRPLFDDEIINELDHWVLKALVNIKTQKPFLEVAKAKFVQLKLLESSREVFVLLVQPYHAVLDVLGVVGLQHLLEQHFSLLQNRRFLLELVPLELFLHLVDSVSKAGKGIEPDAKLGLDSFAGRVEGLVSLAKDNVRKGKIFILHNLWFPNPTAQ
jgi:hypothetical protein